jgi:hypothetical protein
MAKSVSVTAGDKETTRAGSEPTGTPTPPWKWGARGVDPDGIDPDGIDPDGVDDDGVDGCGAAAHGDDDTTQRSESTTRQGERHTLMEPRDPARRVPPTA